MLAAGFLGLDPSSARAQFAPLGGESKAALPHENYDVRDAAMAADVFDDAFAAAARA